MRTSEEKILLYRLFLAAREKGHSGDLIASELKEGSAAALYQKLGRDGFPVCKECGEYSATQQLCPVHLDECRGKRRRRARGGSEEAEALPTPKSSVIDLFREDMKRLEWYVGMLPGLKERLRAERFEAYQWFEDDSDLYHREGLPEEVWREICEEHGVDPAREYFYLPLEPTSMPLGAQATPWHGLSRLIVMHVLLGGSLDPLVEELHPAPDDLDRQALKNRLYDKKHGLLAQLSNVAKTVRGAKVRKGAPTPGATRYEMETARFIAKLDEEGYSDKAICEKLKEEGFLDERGRRAGVKISVEDVRRLRDLKLRPPDL